MVLWCQCTVIYKFKHKMPTPLSRTWCQPIAVDTWLSFPWWPVNSWRKVLIHYSSLYSLILALCLPKGCEWRTVLIALLSQDQRWHWDVPFPFCQAFHGAKSPGQAILAFLPSGCLWDQCHLNKPLTNRTWMSILVSWALCSSHWGWCSQNVTLITCWTMIWPSL